MVTRTRHEEIVEALAALENQFGQLSPEQVLDHAADPKSPLHRCFEWNPEKAAHAYRLDQARALIRTVRYEIQTRKQTVSTVRYVHDVRAERDQGYVRVERVDEASLAEATVTAEIDRVTAMIERGRGIAAALGREEEFVRGVRRAL